VRRYLWVSSAECIFSKSFWRIGPTVVFSAVGWNVFFLQLFSTKSLSGQHSNTLAEFGHTNLLFTPKTFCKLNEALRLFFSLTNANVDDECLHVRPQTLTTIELRLPLVALLTVSRGETENRMRFDAHVAPRAARRGLSGDPIIFVDLELLEIRSVQPE
jgi:hypothetical protein